MNAMVKLQKLYTLQTKEVFYLCKHNSIKYDISSLEALDPW